MSSGFRVSFWIDAYVYDLTDRDGNSGQTWKVINALDYLQFTIYVSSRKNGGFAFWPTRDRTVRLFGGWGGGGQEKRKKHCILRRFLASPPSLSPQTILESLTRTGILILSGVRNNTVNTIVKISLVLIPYPYIFTVRLLLKSIFLFICFLRNCFSLSTDGYVRNWILQVSLSKRIQSLLYLLTHFLRILILTEVWCSSSWVTPLSSRILHLQAIQFYLRDSETDWRPSLDRLLACATCISVLYTNLFIFFPFWKG